MEKINVFEENTMIARALGEKNYVKLVKIEKANKIAIFAFCDLLLGMFFAWIAYLIFSKTELNWFANVEMSEFVVTIGFLSMIMHPVCKKLRKGLAKLLEQAF